MIKKTFAPSSMVHEQQFVCYLKVSTLDNPDFINVRALTPKVCTEHVSGMADKLCTGDVKMSLGHWKAGHRKLTTQGTANRVPS
jgi:hypothetical protein